LVFLWAAAPTRMAQGERSTAEMLLERTVEEAKRKKPKQGAQYTCGSKSGGIRSAEPGPPEAEQTINAAAITR